MSGKENFVIIHHCGNGQWKIGILSRMFSPLSDTMLLECAQDPLLTALLRNHTLV